MSSLYREPPKLLLCPRCGELLDAVFSGVAACPRGQGAWIAQPTVDTAFGKPRWPSGQSMRWHDELECPECVVTGIVTKMSARGSGDVRVDACQRLLGLEAGTDELLELQHRIRAGGMEELADLEARLGVIDERIGP